MRILGIDPGSRLTGFGVVNVTRSGKVSYLASGCVASTEGGLPERLTMVYRGIAEVIDAYRPESVAVEKVFMARNADSALKLGQARGAAICAAANRDLEVSEYTALQIKRAVVGKGHAGKQQVQHMVKVLLGLSESPRADAADALACAICHANQAVGNAALLRGLGRHVQVIK